MVKHSSKRVFYVYALLDPRKPGPFYYGHWKFDFEPFYIGKGKGGRAVIHLCPGADGTNTHKIRKIRNIRKTGEEPIVVIKRAGLLDREALALEIRLIDEIGRGQDDGPLVNLTAGGEGAAGYVATKKTRDKLRAIALRQWATMSPKTLADRSRKLSDIAKKRELMLTPNKRAEIKRKISKSVLSGLADRSQKAKAEHHAKIGAAVKASWSNLSSEEYEARCAIYKSIAKYRSPVKDEQARRDAISRASKARWASMSVKERQKLTRKIAASRRANKTMVAKSTTRSTD